MRKALPSLLVALGAGWLAPTGAPAAVPAWPDSLVARVEALAVLETLNAELLSHDSATLTLERWCADHHLAASPRIVAHLARGADTPATGDQRRLLQVDADEPVRYRHVELACGDRVLSEADNWYGPSRLTPAMNRVLDETDTPFGRAVQDLHFTRHTLGATLLWHPLPEGWELGTATLAPGTGPLTMPPHVLEQRAILATPGGLPISTVVETYTSEVLAFPAPR